MLSRGLGKEHSCEKSFETIYNGSITPNDK